MSTDPPVVFRNGSTAASHSPASSASQASAKVRRARRSASGNILSAAISENDPVVPPNDTLPTFSSPAVPASMIFRCSLMVPILAPFPPPWQALPWRKRAGGACTGAGG